jgi:DNA-binding response OmpR family regulator
LKQEEGVRGFHIMAIEWEEKVPEIVERAGDLLVLDVMMPKKSGYEFCKELKSNTWTKDIPIMLLTAVGEAVPTTTYSHYEGMTTEAEDYVAKPVDAATLAEAVERLIGR